MVLHMYPSTADSVESCRDADLGGQLCPCSLADSEAGSTTPCGGTWLHVASLCRRPWIVTFLQLYRYQPGMCGGLIQLGPANAPSARHWWWRTSLEVLEQFDNKNQMHVSFWTVQGCPAETSKSSPWAIQVSRNSMPPIMWWAGTAACEAAIKAADKDQKKVQAEAERDNTGRDNNTSVSEEDHAKPEADQTMEDDSSTEADSEEALHRRARQRQRKPPATATETQPPATPSKTQPARASQAQPPAAACETQPAATTSTTAQAATAVTKTEDRPAQHIQRDVHGRRVCWVAPDGRTVEMLLTYRQGSSAPNGGFQVTCCDHKHDTKPSKRRKGRINKLACRKASSFRVREPNDHIRAFVALQLWAEEATRFEDRESHQDHRLQQRLDPDQINAARARGPEVDLEQFIQDAKASKEAKVAKGPPASKVTRKAVKGAKKARASRAAAVTQRDKDARATKAIEDVARKTESTHSDSDSDSSGSTGSGSSSSSSSSSSSQRRPGGGSTTSAVQPAATATLATKTVAMKAPDVPTPGPKPRTSQPKPEPATKPDPKFGPKSQPGSGGRPEPSSQHKQSAGQHPIPAGGTSISATPPALTTKAHAENTSSSSAPATAGRPPPTSRVVCTVPAATAAAKAAALAAQPDLQVAACIAPTTKKQTTTNTRTVTAKKAETTPSAAKAAKGAQPGLRVAAERIPVVSTTSHAQPKTNAPAVSGTVAPMATGASTSAPAGFAAKLGPRPSAGRAPITSPPAEDTTTARATSARGQQGAAGHAVAPGRPKLQQPATDSTSRPHPAAQQPATTKGPAKPQLASKPPARAGPVASRVAPLGASRSHPDLLGARSATDPSSKASHMLQQQIAQHDHTTEQVPVAQLACEFCSGPHEDEGCPLFQAVLHRSLTETTEQKRVTLQQGVAGRGCQIHSPKITCIDVPGDGNCFFTALGCEIQRVHPDAVADRLPMLEQFVNTKDWASIATTLREFMLVYLRTTTDRFHDMNAAKLIEQATGMSMAAYCTAMAGPHKGTASWGGFLEAVFICRAVGHRLACAMFQQLVPGDENSPHQALAWVGELNYPKRLVAITWTGNHWMRARLSNIGAGEVLAWAQTK